MYMNTYTCMYMNTCLSFSRLLPLVLSVFLFFLFLSLFQLALYHSVCTKRIRPKNTQKLHGWLSPFLTSFFLQIALFVTQW